MQKIKARNENKLWPIVLTQTFHVYTLTLNIVRDTITQ